MGLQITPEMVSRHAVVPASSRQVCEVIVILPFTGDKKL